MFGLRRRYRETPKTDLQNRLRAIEDRCDAINGALLRSERPADAATLASLAYEIGYVARILELHLSSGER
jgi:hypothetical protein